MLIKPFDILLESGSDIGSFFIKLFTRSKYSHAAMALKDGLIVHSTFKTGVAIVNFETWKRYYGGQWDVYRYVGDLSLYEDIMNKFVIDVAGTPYDWKGVISFVFPWIRESSERYFCSELVAATYSKVNIYLVTKPFFRISPADLSRSPLLYRVQSVDMASRVSIAHDLACSKLSVV